MFTRSFLGVCAAMCFVPFLCAQGSPDGHWEGTLSIDNRNVGLTLDLTKDANSEWIASMGIPSEKAKGLVVMDVQVKDNSVSFVAVMLRMAKVNLILGQDGKMKGTLSFPMGPQNPIPVEFNRTGEASVELVPASPAVSRELEGDWVGSLQISGRAFRIIIHMKNRPDKTVAATIDTPETNAIGLPLDNVKQTGQRVEFGIKVANSSYQGTLNQEGTELSGEWIDGDSQNRMTLTLRRK